MSADKGQPESVFKVAILWGLLGCSGVVAADDEVVPELEFLEYLGSWEESDEDWVLFIDTVTEQLASEGTRTDPAKKEQESVETDDET